MKKKWLWLYQILIIALSLWTAIRIFLYMDTTTDKILYFVFLLFSFFLIPFIHECGHVFFGLCVGMKLHEVNLFNLKFIFLKNKIQVKKINWKEQEDSCKMYPIKIDHLSSRFLWMTAGGLIFNLIFIAVALISIYFAHQPFVTCFFGALLPFACYLFLFNLVPFENENGSSDGKYILSLLLKEDSAKVMLSCLAIQGELAQGYRPSEIEEDLFEKVPQIAEDEKIFSLLEWLRYLRALDQNDIKKAKEYLARLEQLDDDYQLIDDCILAEIGYGYCIDCVDKEKALDYLELVENDEKNTATSCRIQATYALAFGEDATVWIEKGFNCLKQEEFSGIARMEEKLLQSLKNSVRKK